MLRELINREDFCIITKRLRLVPLNYEYINEYYKEFNSEITRYQYPEPFISIEATKEFFTNFIELRKEGIVLVCIIIDMKGAFIGSVEVYHIHTSTPEIGIWISQKYQSKGYGFEAIKGIINYIKANEKIDYFIYEADCRNNDSAKLINKLNGEKQGHKDVISDSGKELKLDIYYVK